MTRRQAVTIAVGCVLVGALLLGGAALAGHSGPSFSGQAASEIETGPVEGPLPEQTGPDRKGKLAEILDRLVQRGVITAAQKDKILAAIAEQAKAEKPRAEKRRGPQARHFIGKSLEDAAAAIGISVSELRKEHVGESLAQVAQAHGVSRADLVAKLTTSATAKIDKAVSDGKLTAEQAARLRANLAERIGKFVDGVHRAKR